MEPFRRARVMLIKRSLIVKGFITSETFPFKVPVNFKFCFEGMEESGSEGLDQMLMSRQNTKFMQEVDSQKKN